MNALPGYDDSLTYRDRGSYEPATCRVCNEELADCACDEEEDLPRFTPEPLLVLAHPAPLALRR